MLITLQDFSLQGDALLRKYGISLDYNRSKNKNSNSIIDKGIQELEHKMINIDPSGGPLTEVPLVVEVLNTRIRNRGLSAREILFQRDQNTNSQLSLDDTSLALEQTALCEGNHNAINHEVTHHHP